MIILPTQYLGLHPALPERPSPYRPASEISTGILTGGVAGSLPLIFSGAFRWRTPLPYAVALKMATWGTVGFCTLNLATGIGAQKTAERFLRAEGIEMPRRKLVTRLEHLWDIDNQVILGGLTGIWIASRLRRPWSVSGWRRWLGAFSFGSSGTIATTMVANEALKSQDEHKADLKKLEEYRKSVSDGRALIMETLLKARQEQTMPSSPDETVRAAKPFGSPSGSGGGGSSSSKQGPSGLVQPAAPNPDDIVRTGPHLGQNIPGESEPAPIANTNYLWKSDAPVEDLEKHLSMLRKRREKLALEAELVWAWLSEKELDYYNSPDGDEKAAKMRYVETLGSLHTKTWLEASACDWMIADSKKRIEQLRSASTNDGKVTWRAGCSDHAAKQSPEHALKILRLNAKGVKQQEEQLEQIKAQMAMNMVDPDFDQREETEVYDPTQGKMVSEKEVLLKAKDQVELLLKDAKEYQETIGQIIADAEKKSK